MASDRVWLVADRFEQIKVGLLARGFAIDPGPRDPNEWDEIHLNDPPTGLVRLKGVRLADLDDDDSDFDPDITFSVAEYWTTDLVDGAPEERGFHLAECSYHGHCHGSNLRWDFDPARHPTEPWHHHPPHQDGDPRITTAIEPITPEQAMDDFGTWIAAQP